jgi:hypothetical protein
MSFCFAWAAAAAASCNARRVMNWGIVGETVERKLPLWTCIWWGFLGCSSSLASERRLTLQAAALSPRLAIVAEHSDYLLRTQCKLHPNHHHHTTHTQREIYNRSSVFAELKRIVIWNEEVRSTPLNYYCRTCRGLAVHNDGRGSWCWFWRCIVVDLDVICSGLWLGLACARHRDVERKRHNQLSILVLALVHYFPFPTRLRALGCWLLVFAVWKFLPVMRFFSLLILLWRRQELQLIDPHHARNPAVSTWYHFLRERRMQIHMLYYLQPRIDTKQCEKVSLVPNCSFKT